MEYRVVILTTGQEILSGAVVDTNSSYMCNLLLGTNFHAVRHITVGDDFTELKDAIVHSLELADLVITTGGLGPTEDDNTVGAICEVVNLQEVVHEPSREKMLERFRKMERGSYPTDDKMVSVPKDAHVFLNTVGIAPGFIISNGEKHVASLPGVPGEMKAMFEKSFLPYIKENFNFREELKLSYTVAGMIESEINRRLKTMELPENVSWGVSAKLSHSQIFFQSSSPEPEYKEKIDKAMGELFAHELLRGGATSPEEELILLLKENSLTIGTAESCTGGLMGKCLTDIPGSSQVYMGTVTSYSNDVKTSLLKVDPHVLKERGAVSSEVAIMMARNARRVLGCDVALSTTGVAGPGGGSKEKPVGTVYGCLSMNNDDFVYRFELSGNRFQIREGTVAKMFNILRRKMIELKPGE